MKISTRQGAAGIAVATSAVLLSSGLSLPADAAETTPVVLTLSGAADPGVNGVVPSTQIKPGLSLESEVLSTPNLLGGSKSRMATYMNLLNGTKLIDGGKLVTIPGASSTNYVRIGANAVDFTTYVGKKSLKGNRQINTTSFVKANIFAKKSKSRVILSTRVKGSNAATSTRMLLAARNRMGSNLAGTIFGNEPDFYKGGLDSYAATYTAYLTSLRNARGPVSKLPVYGPATSLKGATYFNQFMDRAQTTNPELMPNTISHHNYNLSRCDKDSAGNFVTHTPGDLLSQSTYTKSQASALVLTTRAQQVGRAGVFDERSSVACGGEKGVADSYASALWGLDSQLQFARLGVRRSYFHSMIGTCGSPSWYDNLLAKKPIGTNAFYSPFCAANRSSTVQGIVRAQPVYYGMLAASMVGNGTFLETGYDNNANNDLHLYAVRTQDGAAPKVTVVAINRSATAKPLSVKLFGGQTTAKRIQLDNPAVSDPAAKLADTNPHHLTLGGNAIRYAGMTGKASWVGANTEQLTVSGGQTSTTIPAYSASIFYLS